MVVTDAVPKVREQVRSWPSHATSHATRHRPRRTPRIPIRTGQALLALTAAAVVLGELDRLVTGAISPTGESRSLTDLVGPLGPARGDVWQVWAASQFHNTVAVALAAHVLADVVLVVAYTWLLRRVAAPSHVANRALIVLVGTDLAEDAMLVVGAAGLAMEAVPDWLRWPLAAMTTAKWASAFVLLVAVVRHAVIRRKARVGVTMAAQALWYQRLSVLVVLVVGVLSVVPLPDIWDQLPDVQRRWADGTAESWRHLLLAALLTLVVTVQLFVLGRLRSERAWQADVERAAPGDARPSLWWLVAPVLAGLVAAALWLSGRADVIDPGLLVFPLLVPTVLWVASWLLRLFHPPAPVEAPVMARVGRARRVWWVGDLLAAMLLAAAGLGLIRSFTAPVVLGPTGDDTWVDWAVQLALLVAGVVLLIGALPLVAGWARAIDEQDVGAMPQDDARTMLVRVLRPEQHGVLPRRGPLRGLPVALWLLAALVLGAFLLFPIRLPALLGVVATVEAVMGAWVVIVGFLVVHLQHSQPLEVFRLVRMRQNPVILLLVALPVLTSQAGGDPDLHALRAFPVPETEQQLPTPTATSPRPDIDSLLAQWIERSGACDRTVSTSFGDVTVRPMLLLAAQGGGIRAATWTAAALDRLNAEGGCARESVLLSSGVSGGSVGLALGRAADPWAGAQELAQPDALSSAIAGALVGDVIGGATGLRVPGLDGEGHWLDRAGLMETVWERSAPVLSEHYNQAVDGAGGALVLNSTAAGLGCRVLVSQVDLRRLDRVRQDLQSPDVSGAGDEPRCRALTQLPAATLDLQSTYGRCAPDISWATAAMLSARFPTVTPAGRVPRSVQRQPDGTLLDCTSRPDLQLVDGGYAEGSGIGTLADLAPDLAQAVRRHNATALTEGGPVVVPMVAFLQNASRADIAVPPTGLSAELFVPLAGVRAKGLQVVDGTWLQRVGDALADPCPQGGNGAGSPDSLCGAAVRELREPVTGGLVVVAPRTRPAVDPPLGWTLSADSQERLREAMDDQATRCSGPRPGGYACLRDLLQVLNP